MFTVANSSYSTTEASESRAVDSATDTADEIKVANFHPEPKRLAQQTTVWHTQKPSSREHRQTKILILYFKHVFQSWLYMS